MRTPPDVIISSFAVAVTFPFPVVVINIIVEVVYVYELGRVLVIELHVVRVEDVEYYDEEDDVGARWDDSACPGFTISKTIRDKYPSSLSANQSLKKKITEWYGIL